MEHAQQPAAVDGELRPAVPGGEAARLAPDPLAVFGIVGELRGRDPSRVQLIKQAKLRELACRVRQYVDPDPQLPHARGRLVHVDVAEPRVVQRQGKGHAADAAAHDRYAHGGRRPAVFRIPSFTGRHDTPSIPVVVMAETPGFPLLSRLPVPRPSPGSAPDGPTLSYPARQCPSWSAHFYSASASTKASCCGSAAAAAARMVSASTV
jgi:hypothetical protein